MVHVRCFPLMKRYLKWNIFFKRIWHLKGYARAVRIKVGTYNMSCIILLAVKKINHRSLIELLHTRLFFHHVEMFIPTELLWSCFFKLSFYFFFYYFVLAIASHSSLSVQKTAWLQNPLKLEDKLNMLPIGGWRDRKMDD